MSTGINDPGYQMLSTKELRPFEMLTYELPYASRYEPFNAIRDDIIKIMLFLLYDGCMVNRFRNCLASGNYHSGYITALIRNKSFLSLRAARPVSVGILPARPLGDGEARGCGSAETPDDGLGCGQDGYGCCLLFGPGVKKDDAEAARYFRLAAEQGFADGECNYGWCLANGVGATKDEIEAARFFRLAAEQGTRSPSGITG